MYEHVLKSKKDVKIVIWFVKGQIKDVQAGGTFTRCDDDALVVSRVGSIDPTTCDGLFGY
jgi:hypothetical protein